MLLFASLGGDVSDNIAIHRLWSIAESQPRYRVHFTKYVLVYPGL